MDSQTAFVMEQFKAGLRSPDIIPLLEENFSLSNEQARKFISSVLSELQTEEGVRQNKRVKIKNNPGFFTKIIQDQFKSNIVITVDSIDNINYLSSIHVYLDTIIRLTQNIDSTNVPKQVINKLCIGKGETKEAEVVKDVVAKKEQGVEPKDLEPRGDTIKELQFFQEEPSDMDDILALLGEEDEEEDEEEEEEDISEEVAEGGATEGSDDSLGSIPMGLSDESDESVVDNPLDSPSHLAYLTSLKSQWLRSLQRLHLQLAYLTSLKSQLLRSLQRVHLQLAYLTSPKSRLLRSLQRVHHQLAYLTSLKSQWLSEPAKTPSPVGLSDQSEESVAEEPAKTESPVKSPSPVGLSDQSEESVADSPLKTEETATEPSVNTPSPLSNNHLVCLMSLKNLQLIYH